jgi:hypothetical protein
MTVGSMAEADLSFPTATRIRETGIRREMMAVDTSTMTQGYWGVSQSFPWLSTGETGAQNGDRSGSEGQGWNDAYVAALLFNVDCSDS